MTPIPPTRAWYRCHFYITKYVENNDEEPAIISEIMYDLKNEVLAMIETFKFYNQNPFSGLVYTLTSNGEVSLELTYGDK